MAPQSAHTTRIVVAVIAVLSLFVATAAPASAANPVTIPIVDLGVTLDVTPFVQIPDSTNGFRPRPRLNQFAVSDDRLFVVEDFDGRIYELEREGTSGSAELFFDVGLAIDQATDRQLDLTNSFHGGLRSVAFHPEFATNGLFYTSLMETRPTNPNPADFLGPDHNAIVADGVVIEWTYNHGASRVDPASYRQLFRVALEGYDHPIKQMAFNQFAVPGDADYGLLYIAHGDGAEQQARAGGGQNNDALGKILRVDPRASGSQPYTVPADNPFVGDPSMLDEVYALGFRNPHHLSFAQDDSGNAHLLAVDVGRDNVEEVNDIVAGGNYGWSEREGTFVHLIGGTLIDGVAPLPADEAERGYVYPVAQFGHEGPRGQGFSSQAIAGGFVIDNGSPLSGQYFYSDFALSGRVFHSEFDEMLAAVTTLNPNNPNRDSPSDLTQARTGEVSISFDHDANPATPALARDSMLDVFNDAATYDPMTGRADVRFGEGPDGEMYISSKKNGLIYLVTNSLPPGETCQGAVATTAGLVGTDGDDVIIGTPGPDVISGGAGNDIICGRGGADRIDAGSGADYINAGWGSDIIRGGDGNDTILAGPGLDDVEGEGGDDLIRGGRGGDRLVGNGGNDTIYGGDRQDRLFGFAGNDTLFGGTGNDNLRGGAGNDSATGGTGIDQCVDVESIQGCE